MAAGDPWSHGRRRNQMDARIKKIGVIVGALALAGALSAGAVVIAQSTMSPPSPPVTTVPAIGTPSASANSADDDGTADQGHGDAPGTVGAGDDDGTADQGHGDGPGPVGAGNA